MVATTSALNTGLATKQDSGSYATTSALTTGLQITRTQLNHKLQITRTDLQTTRTQLEVTTLKLLNTEARLGAVEQTMTSILSKLNV